MIKVKTRNGQVTCGRLIREDGELVWERRVSEERHLFRFGRAWDGEIVKDAWTVGETILAQLRERKVRRIRYVCESEVYEIDVENFLRQARELDQSEWTAGTEPQWALPRKLWENQSQGRAEQLDLFAEVAA